MKKFVYVVTDRNRTNLHVGMSSDLIKTLEFYKQMPSLFFDSGQQLTRLVYFEEFKTEAQAIGRFKLLSRFTRMQKERLVRSCNPDWVDLTIGLDFEHIISSKTINTQVMLPLGIMS
ncbi:MULTISPECIES: GIY-YIG nuclease family protein [unclassified Pedobacter]|jgi:putative endonuclease|uniref:GIY-YIG nuclease family protein n=1 Tax=unclassified Pedobacter TaxID=2628915 RepID=UPI000D39BE76|nr:MULTISPECIES: GIY-YIG nuclease family protein [unclassified Pedobacter]PTT01125.1 nuclease [Pedobacter sp. HMWF019]HWW41574.1 GIY-YIG nuclease family protein [Pedobacter sp.]